MRVTTSLLKIKSPSIKNFLVTPPLQTRFFNGTFLLLFNLELKKKMTDFRYSNTLLYKNSKVTQHLSVCTLIVGQIRVMKFNL